MRKSLFIVAGFICLVIASLAFINADEPKYKNLKVLSKNISKKELDSVMHFFTMSLGEKCNFCHARNEATKSMDFASDENPNKNTARFMMKMNAKINKKYFKDKDKDHEDHAMMEAVTCYTCHHGSGHPDTKPEMGKGGKMGNPPMGQPMGNPPMNGGGGMNDMHKDSTGGQH